MLFKRVIRKDYWKGLLEKADRKRLLGKGCRKGLLERADRERLFGKGGRKGPFGKGRWEKAKQTIAAGFTGSSQTMLTGIILYYLVTQ